MFEKVALKKCAKLSAERRPIYRSNPLIFMHFSNISMSFLEAEYFIIKVPLVLRTPVAGGHQSQNKNYLLADLSHDKYMMGPRFLEEMK